MVRGVSGFLGERLEEARLARGLTQASLAQMVGKSSPTISSWESGRQSPDLEALEAISAVLSVRPALFTNDVEEGERSYFFRSNVSITVGLRKKAKARLRWAEIIFDELEEWIDFPEIKFPFADSQSLGDIDDALVEATALEARSYWKLANDPIPDVVKLLERAGAIIVRDELGGVKMDGVSFWGHESDRPFILLAEDKASAVRSRFDAAHELGHLLLHRGVKSELLSKADYAELERQAHYFASLFLLPDKAFLKDLSRLDLDGFAALKPKWKISIAAMIMKAHSLDVITDDYKRRLFVQLAARGWRRSEPLDDVLQAELPSALSSAIRLVVDAEKYTKEGFMDQVGLNAEDIESLASLPRGYLRRDAAPVVSLRLTT